MWRGIAPSSLSPCGRGRVKGFRLRRFCRPGRARSARAGTHTPCVIDGLRRMGPRFRGDDRKKFHPGKLHRSRGAHAPEFWDHGPRLKRRGGRRAQRRSHSLCACTVAGARRLSARRLGDFSSPGPRFLVSVPVSSWSAAPVRLIGLSRLGPSETFGTVPVQQAPCGAVVMPPDRVPGRPECVAANHARGRRPFPRGRRNRFASPRGSGRYGIKS
jgi:hypothetical protein